MAREPGLLQRGRALAQFHARVRRDRARERQKVLGLIEDMNANRFTIFRSLTLQRQPSLHAGLIDDAHQDLPSSKIDALLGQLREVAGGGHRALVFSRFTEPVQPPFLRAPVEAVRPVRQQVPQVTEVRALLPRRTWAPAPATAC